MSMLISKFERFEIIMILNYTLRGQFNNKHLQL